MIERQPVPPLEPETAATNGKPRRPATRARRKHLPGGLLRRYKDHRVENARLYRTAYQAVIEVWPPKHKLGRWVASLVADLMVDYLVQRDSHKRGASVRKRKLVRLIYGAFREMARHSTGAAGESDLNHVLTTMMNQQEDTPR